MTVVTRRYRKCALFGRLFGHFEFNRDVTPSIEQCTILASGMSEQEKLSLDDVDGNCRQCGHPFNPHIVLAYDTSDFSKGGEIRCPVTGCNCFHNLDFDFKTIRDLKTV